MGDQDNLKEGDLVKICYEEDQEIVIDQNSNIFETLLTKKDLFRIFWVNKNFESSKAGIVRLSDNCIVNYSKDCLEKVDSKLLNLFFKEKEKNET